MTRRLLLRRPRRSEADVERLVTYCAVNREHLGAWEPLREPGYFTARFWREELARLETLREQGSEMHFLLLGPDGDGPLLGRCSITNIVRGPFQAAHLGFALAAAMVGQGLMQEALNEVIRHAFSDLRLHRLMANYQPHNTRSAALLRRLGFEQEGRAREYLLLNGEWRDHVLTSLINPDWQAPDEARS